jgi:hypothetical protein
LGKLSAPEIESGKLEGPIKGSHTSDDGDLGEWRTWALLRWADPLYARVGKGSGRVVYAMSLRSP